MQNHLVQGLTVVHEGKKVHACKSCGKSFSLAKDLENHISVVHEGQKGFGCDTCGKACTSKSNLKKHVKYMFPNEKEPVVCYIEKKA